MMNAKIRKFAGLTTATVMLAAMGVGCDAPDESAGTASTAEATATGAASADQAPKTATSNSANKGRYDVRSPADPVPVDKKAKIELAITPADGLKINKDFPWSLEFSETSGVRIAQKSISKGQLDLADSEATIPMMLEAATAGDHTLEATANFSVCNDTKCYVIRDEPLSFKFAAAETNADQPKADQPKIDERGGEEAGATDK